MDEEKPKRPRIATTKPAIIDTIVDPLSYTVSAASLNAQHKKKFVVNINLDYFVDGHYVKRLIHGDVNGVREGIDPPFIESLVEQSFLHVLHYCIRNPKINIINYVSVRTPPIRVVVMQTFAHEPTLNIIVEYHFIDINTYEATVITALRKDDFDESDGQHTLIMTDGDSTINVKSAGKRVELDRFPR